MERFDDGTPTSIREHAAQWFLRLHAHDLSVAERFAYLQWLKASPMHIGETLQICKLYSILYPMKKQLFFTNEDDISNVIDLSRRDSAASSRTRSSWHIRVLVAVLAIGVVLLAGSVASSWFAPTLQKQASEWRSLALNDGSLVSVDPYTQLRNQFGERQRLLELARGEALFEVAKDASRPFVVDPALRSQRILGQFHADDPASFAQSIALVKKGVVVHRSRDVIRLQPVGQPR
jgi:transmembrane sensor